MVQSEGAFPFGEPIRRVAQGDRSPKRVFVLGKYASAVHARWVGPEGEQKVKALAVASEPYIFWKGEGAVEIVSRIVVPVEAGRLLPVGALNGPSGRSLDDDFLVPMGLDRDNAWLCDLVPHSCMNDGQAAAVRESYDPLVGRLGLPRVDWDPVPVVLADDARRREIAAELHESEAEILVTLGDSPLEWFGAAFGTGRALREYGRAPESYGVLHDVEVDGRAMKLLPLVHPRQAAGLGGHNPDWTELHGAWRDTRAGELLS